MKKLLLLIIIPLLFSCNKNNKKTNQVKKEFQKLYNDFQGEPSDPDVAS